MRQEERKLRQNPPAHTAVHPAKPTTDFAENAEILRSPAFAPNAMDKKKWIAVLVNMEIAVFVAEWAC